MAKQIYTPPVKLPGTAVQPTIPSGWANYPPVAPSGWNPTVPPPVLKPVQGIAPAPGSYQYPGSVMGAPWLDVQNFIRKQKKAFGVFVLSVPGSRVTQNLDIPGDAKILLGFKIGGNLNLADPTCRINLMVNNEKIVSDCSPQFFNNDFAMNSTEAEYFTYIRPVSGNDSAQLTIDEPLAGAATTYEFCFFYL